MTDLPNNFERLHKTLSGLEEVILRSSDNEIVLLSSTGEIDEVQAIISRQMKSYLVGNKLSVAPPVGKKSNRSKPIQPHQFMALYELVARRPDFSPQLRATFQTGKKPTTGELKEFEKELIRLGVLPSDKNQK